MPKPVKYALSSSDQRIEMEAISKCWEILSTLDENGRMRSIRWLDYWASSERAPSDTLDF